MREALALVGEEGLEPMWERHQRLHEDLWKGLRDMGLEPFVQNPNDRLATVNTIKVCASPSWALCCSAL
jgi:alanine-glyoxylate transaminase/serine-glyoxylate transaminase/serine-pyruvate transaminase